MAYWNFLAVGNYAARFYKFAMVEVKATQNRIHAQLVADASAHEQEVLALLAAATTAKDVIVQKLTDFTTVKGEYIMAEWRDLLPRLIST